MSNLTQIDFSKIGFFYRRWEYAGIGKLQHWYRWSVTEKAASEFKPAGK
jgi:hypothetical protein